MKTEIIAIIDRSGSMGPLAKEAIGGFNAFVDGQKVLPGNARISIMLFDHEFIQLAEGVDIKEAPALSPLNYVPRGSTAMNDAIGRALAGQGDRIRQQGWAEKVVVCLVSDGFENASKEYTRAQVQALVKAREADGWSFVFLFSGISQEQAVAQTQAYGVNTMSLNNVARSFAGGASGQSVTYDTLGAAVGNLRSGKDAA